ncbi:MAG: hypothetical protein ABJN69_01265 [Hellea sp.]
MQFIRLTATGLIAVSLGACGGGGGNTVAAPQAVASIPAPPPPPPPPPVPVTSVKVSGKITYDRVPHAQNSGLDYANVTEMPIRGAVIEAVNASGDVLFSTISAPDGSYDFTLDAETDIRIRAKAQLLSDKAAHWDFRVTDNTQENQLYALQGSLANTGKSASQSRDLHAPSGWTGQSYGEARSAAPFAILDSVYMAAQAFAAIDPNIDFPALELRWSVNNRAAIGEKAQGQIGTSAYFPDADSEAIYLLGEEGRDTDEYDPHVIIHEWGHYFEHQMSRTDSIGGLHSLNDRLDARVAYSEGWGNALSAMITGDPIYRDSSGSSQKFGFSYNLETRDITNPGWFNEASIGAILYDIFDSASDGPDNIAAGLKPIYNVMSSDAYKDAPVFATIFALADGLRREGSIGNGAINSLLDSQSISGEGPNGNGESNSGAIRSALPVYKEVTFNGPSVHLCSVDDAGVYNKLGNREFIFLNLDTDKDVTISAMKASGDEQRDPDFNIWQGRELINKSASSIKGEEVFKGRLSAGDYVIEAYDFFNINGTGSKRGDGCYNFSVTG